MYIVWLQDCALYIYRNSPGLPAQTQSGTILPCQHCKTCCLATCHSLAAPESHTMLGDQEALICTMSPQDPCGLILICAQEAQQPAHDHTPQHIHLHTWGRHILPFVCTVYNSVHDWDSFLVCPASESVYSCKILEL